MVYINKIVFLRASYNLKNKLIHIKYLENDGIYGHRKPIKELSIKMIMIQLFLTLVFVWWPY